MLVFFLQISLYWLVLSFLVVLAMGVLGLLIYRSVGEYHRHRTPFPPNHGSHFPIPPRPKPAWMVEDGYIENFDERGYLLGYRRLERDENGAEVVRYYDEDGNRM